MNLLHLRGKFVEDTSKLEVSRLPPEYNNKEALIKLFGKLGDILNISFKSGSDIVYIDFEDDVRIPTSFMSEFTFHVKYKKVRYCDNFVENRRCSKPKCRDKHSLDDSTLSEPSPTQFVNQASVVRQNRNPAGVTVPSMHPTTSQNQKTERYGTVLRTDVNERWNPEAWLVGNQAQRRVPQHSMGISDPARPPTISTNSSSTSDRSDYLNKASRVNAHTYSYTALPGNISVPLSVPPQLPVLLKPQQSQSPPPSSLGQVSNGHLLQSTHLINAPIQSVIQKLSSVAPVTNSAFTEQVTGQKRSIEAPVPVSSANNRNVVGSRVEEEKLSAPTIASVYGQQATPVSEQSASSPSVSPVIQMDDQVVDLSVSHPHHSLIVNTNTTTDTRKPGRPKGAVNNNLFKEDKVTLRRIGAEMRDIKECMGQLQTGLSQLNENVMFLAQYIQDVLPDVKLNKPLPVFHTVRFDQQQQQQQRERIESVGSVCNTVNELLINMTTSTNSTSTSTTLPVTTEPITTELNTVMGDIKVPEKENSLSVPDIHDIVESEPNIDISAIMEALRMPAETHEKRLFKIDFVIDIAKSFQHVQLVLNSGGTEVIIQCLIDELRWISIASQDMNISAQIKRNSQLKYIKSFQNLLKFFIFSADNSAINVQDVLQSRLTDYLRGIEVNDSTENSSSVAIAILSLLELTGIRATRRPLKRKIVLSTSKPLDTVNIPDDVTLHQFLATNEPGSASRPRLTTSSDDNNRSSVTGGGRIAGRGMGRGAGRGRIQQYEYRQNSTTT